MRIRLTYANVMATLAVFLVLGGGAYAATSLPKNSVGSQQLKAGAITPPKLSGAVKKSIGSGVGLAGLPGQPGPKGDPGSSASAGQFEGWHEVGTQGEPQFQTTWSNPTAAEKLETVAFYKDNEGIVHLRGWAKGGGAGTAVFYLPPGFRPAPDHRLQVPMVCIGCGAATVGAGSIRGGAQGDISGEIYSPGTFVSFDGITFRAES